MGGRRRQKALKIQRELTVDVTPGLPQRRKETKWMRVLSLYVTC